MDVYLIVRSAKTSTFVDVKETTTILQLKQILQDIIKNDPESFGKPETEIQPSDMKIYTGLYIEEFITKTDKEILADDSKTMVELGLTDKTACAELPAMVKLVINTMPEIEQYSMPPELPEAMKAEESTTKAITDGACSSG